MINISSCLALRVEVVLVDPSRENPNYMGKWHVFLPSDVSLVCLPSYQMHLQIDHVMSDDDNGFPDFC